MKVLTLHQPYATLAALGVKTIETRGQNTHVRGRIAIHAAARKPDVRGCQERWFGDLSLGETTDGAFALTDYDNIETSQSTWIPLPLGAIVATANLVDSVPILEADDELIEAWRPHVAPIHSGAALWFWQGASVHENASTGRPVWRHQDITDQLPYGDFRPGRWAWILDDVQPLAVPVPFKGGQGWSRTWEPS